MTLDDIVRYDFAYAMAQSQECFELLDDVPYHGARIATVRFAARRIVRYVAYLRDGSKYYALSRSFGAVGGSEIGRIGRVGRSYTTISAARRAINNKMAS